MGERVKIYTFCQLVFISYCPAVLLCLFLFFCAFILKTSYAETAPHLNTLTISRITTLPDKSSKSVRIVSFIVETVYNTESLKKGLSDRQEMDLNHGMLFKLNDNEETVFWMKGMKFPLDILFFDRNKIIIDIFEHLSPCDECVLIKPSKPASFALEINSGIIKKYGIQIGDTFDIEDYR